MKPNIHDVAKIAGVSSTTVSRVLNNRGYISEKTKEKVYKAMEEINYFPNDLARSLFRKRTNLIGLIIPNSSNPFFGELAFHIESICTSMGYKLLLCNSLHRKDKEEKYLEMLIRNQVDGVIAVTYNRGILNYHKQNLPIVAIDHYLSDTIPVVGSDNYDGGKKAAELLIEKGCRHIVHLNGPLNSKHRQTSEEKHTKTSCMNTDGSLLHMKYPFISITMILFQHYSMNSLTPTEFLPAMISWRLP